MYQVIKRDGRRVDFDLARIANAITKAFDAAKIPYNTAIIDLLALQVTADYAGKVRNNEIGVEDIQDSVEAVLQRAGYAAVAKSYILYRKNREKLREMRSTVLDYKKLVDDYLRVSDWRVKENSTVTYSVGGLILSNSGAITANYWLSEIYDEEIADAHRSADLHLHDLSMLTGYCAGWTPQAADSGGAGRRARQDHQRPGQAPCDALQPDGEFPRHHAERVGGRAGLLLLRHLSRALRAQADKLSYNEVKQCVESFVYGVNTPSRWGTQAPFSNITLDWTVPADLADQPCHRGRQGHGLHLRRLSERRWTWSTRPSSRSMIEGDANGRGFQYPIPTYSITQGFRLVRDGEQPPAL